MSVLGKVLIVFNLLAAGAFAYLTLENWKVRQELTWREFENTAKLRGIPVAAPADAKVDEGRIAFVFHVKPGVDLESVSKETLDKLIPKGDTEFGGEPVANQHEEISRLLKKVQANIAAKTGQNPQFERMKETRRFLLNLARSGAERDGITALYNFSSFDPAQPFLTKSARNDLPLVARLPSQVAALKALLEIADLGDPQAISPAEVRQSRIDGVRLVVKNFIKGEAAHGVADADAKVRLRDTTIEAAFRPNAGEAERAAMVAEATLDATGFKFLADLATNTLSSRDLITQAKDAILGYVTSKKITTEEGAALTEVVGCILPAAGFDGAAAKTAVEKAGTQLLEHKFQEALLPVATKAAKAGESPHDEKARKIAHILYHIDADRHTAVDAKIVADRKDWHQRVVTIVGMQQYVRAAEVQAAEFNDATARLLQIVAEEEGSFRSEYEGLVQYCLALHTQWVAQEAQLKQQLAVEQTNKKLLDERQTEFDNLTTTLIEAQDKTKAAQDKLKQVQEKRFQILKDLRDAQQKLLELESDLRRLEFGK